MHHLTTPAFRGTIPLCPGIGALCQRERKILLFPDRHMLHATTLTPSTSPKSLWIYVLFPFRIRSFAFVLFLARPVAAAKSQVSDMRHTWQKGEIYSPRISGTMSYGFSSVFVFLPLSLQVAKHRAYFLTFSSGSDRCNCRTRVHPICSVGTYAAGYDLRVAVLPRRLWIFRCHVVRIGYFFYGRFAGCDVSTAGL